MTSISGWIARGRGWFSDNKGPWGGPPPGGGDNNGAGGDGSGGGDEPPAAGPWGSPGGSGKGGGRRPNVTSLDDFLQKSKSRMGGGGGGGRPSFNFEPNGRMIGWGLAGLAGLWIVLTSTHVIGSAERGVVTRFGRYSHTLAPGVGLTLPSPIDRVQKVDVENIREINLGSANEETLMLTGDQNIIDIAYQVRWNIRAPEQYLYELAQPEDTIKQVAESAMRQVVAQVTLIDAMGNRRGEIESRVRQEMQQTLDAYQAGVVIQGVAVRQADPPEKVNDAFKEVTAAQQQAQSYINQANAYALQLRQKAQGEATAFDKVYEQYRLAPGVTKRRMYYETMEKVLQGADKTIVEAPGVNSYLPLNELRKPQPQPQGGAK